MRTLAMLTSAVTLCTALQSASQPAAPPGVSADSLQLVGITLMPVRNQPQIAVGLGNRLERPLWVEVTVEAGRTVRCEGTRRELPAMKIRWLMCPVDRVEAARIYPVRIRVFHDGRATAAADTRDAQVVFTLRDVQWLESQLQADN